MFEHATVNCPICKKSVIWDEKNPFRPFCSKNCQLIDLGEWILLEVFQYKCSI